jgi:hypothetical protein
MKKSFVVTTFVDVEIEDGKIPEVLKDFRACIKDEATVMDVFAHAAQNEAQWEGQFCEGIGENGREYVARVTCIDTEEDSETQ